MIVKRVLDALISAFGIVVFSPLIIITAVAIRIVDGPPVLFRQRRVGLHGELFHIRKFRTMRPGGNGPQLSSANTSRITPVGRTLRKWKIDELPQLFDVLEGKMSLVGPRPEVPEYVSRWPSADREIILSVRPGITDPASIVYRNEAELLAAAEDAEAFYLEKLLPAKVATYVEYVESRSILGDMKILGQTLAALIFDADGRN